MNAALSDEDRQRALEAYFRGVSAAEEATGGTGSATEAVDEAIAQLHLCLEYLVTREAWLTLHAEAHHALGRAYMLRARGDPLENARTGAAHFQEALDAQLDHWWRFLSAP
jgi:hypothetical protein